MELWDVTKEPTPKGDVVLGHWKGLCWYVWLPISTSPWYGASFLLYLLTATLLHRGVFVVRKKEARGTRCILIDLRALSFLRSLRFLLLFYFLLEYPVGAESAEERGTAL